MTDTRWRKPPGVNLHPIRLGEMQNVPSKEWMDGPIYTLGWKHYKMLAKMNDEQIEWLYAALFAKVVHHEDGSCGCSLG